MRAADVFAFDRAGVRIGRGVQFGLVVGAVLTVGSVLFSATAGVAAAAGALNSAAATSGGVTRPRLAMTAALAGLTIASFLGSITADVAWLRLVLVAVLAALCGSFADTGPYGSAIGNQTLIGFVIFGRFPRTPEVAAQAAGLVAAGALIQIVVLSLAPIATPQGRHAAAQLRRPPGAPAMWRRLIGRLRAQYRPPTRTEMWHALRLAGAMEAAEIIALYTGQMRAYWIALTVAVVMRPDWTVTRLRGVQRFVGTLAGASLVGLLVDLWKPGLLATGLLVLVLSCAMFAVQRASFPLYSALLSADVVLLLGVIMPSGVLTAADRALFTTVGGVLAVGVHFVFHRRASRADAPT